MSNPQILQARPHPILTHSQSWSPLHELAPETPLRHGHAISIDMAYSATLANQRGLLSDEEHSRLLTLFSRAGLSIDHPQFDDDVLEKGTAAILKTRDGLLRLAVPNPLGKCTFLNDVSTQELRDALRRHKELAQAYPRAGAGLEAYVDSSDTGYTDGEVQTAAEQPSTEASARQDTLSVGGVTGRAGDLLKGAIGKLSDGVKVQA